MCSSSSVSSVSNQQAVELLKQVQDQLSQFDSTLATQSATYMCTSTCPCDFNALFGKDASASVTDQGTDIWGIRSGDSGLEARFKKYSRINKLTTIDSNYVPLYST
jgi:hypothetical protein